MRTGEKEEKSGSIRNIIAKNIIATERGGEIRSIGRWELTKLVNRIFASSGRNKLIGPENIKGQERSRGSNGIYSGNTSSACRGIKIFWFLHGLVMEALSRDGSSFRRESLGVVVRDGPVFSVCKSLLLFFRFYLGNYCSAFDQSAKLVILPFQPFVSSLFSLSLSPPSSSFFPFSFFFLYSFRTPQEIKVWQMNSRSCDVTIVSFLRLVRPFRSFIERITE